MSFFDQHHLDALREEGPALFFGDETSFAAAEAMQQSQPARSPGHFIFAVASIADARAVVSTLGLQEVTLLQKTSDGSHLEQAVRELKRLGSMFSASAWFFTGCAPSIQAVRKRLKADQISLNRGAVKPYWSPRKKGID